MKTILTTSCATLGLLAALSTPAFADCASEIQALKSAHSGGGTAASTTADAGGQQAGETAETEGTPAMNAAVGQTAASEQDVAAQNKGEPTAAEQASGATSTGEGSMEAMLITAENAQKAGNEAACMDAIEKAKAAPM